MAKKIESLNYKEIHDLLANQLAEISDNKLNGKELEVEIQKSNAMTGLATSLINLGKLQLQGARYFGKDAQTEKLFVGQGEE